MSDFQNAPINNTSETNDVINQNQQIVDTNIGIEQSSKQEKKPSFKLIIIMLILMILLGLVYFLVKGWQKDQNLTTSEEPNVVVNDNSFNQDNAAVEVLDDNKQTQDLPELVIDENCDNFPDQLIACNPYKCQFTHPLTQEIMTREIIGMIEDNCYYIEQMPNGGQMKCQYDEPTRLAVVEYYKDLAQVDTISVEMSGKLSPDGVVDLETKEVVDGQEISENPLQEALDTGMCEITGY